MRSSENTWRTSIVACASTYSTVASVVSPSGILGMAPTLRQVSVAVCRVYEFHRERWLAPAPASRLAHRLLHKGSGAGATNKKHLDDQA